MNKGNWKHGEEVLGHKNLETCAGGGTSWTKKPGNMGRRFLKNEHRNLENGQEVSGLGTWKRGQEYPVHRTRSYKHREAVVTLAPKQELPECAGDT